jgi:DNA-binding response OmpR family regulator
MRLLVVEDEPGLAEVVAAMLGQCGHEVRTASDGAAALKLAEEYVPDAALIDIGLPDTSGYEVARRLRKQPGFETVSLVALSRYTSAGHILRARAAGFDHYLVKPTEFGAFKEVLDRIEATRSSTLCSAHRASAIRRADHDA